MHEFDIIKIVYIRRKFYGAIFCKGNEHVVETILLGDYNIGKILTIWRGNFMKRSDNGGVDCLRKWFKFKDGLIYGVTGMA